MPTQNPTAIKIAPGGTLRVMLFLPAILCLGAALVSGARRLIQPGTQNSVQTHERTPHAHQNARGGVVQSVGNHHVELLREQGGKIHLFLLGEDERELRPASAAKITAYVRPDGATESLPLELSAAPQPGEPAGFASAFTGTLPPAMRSSHAVLSCTLPLSDRVYRVHFSLEPAEPHEETPAMPAALPSDVQSTLYRNPAGGYSRADIEANGLAAPQEKYRSMTPRHNPRPARGERVCPITQTKADARFSWIIGGKRYLFCCPPCIDEFVQRARTEPGAIRQPEAYVKR